jgi:hypothetical protein
VFIRARNCTNPEPAQSSPHPISLRLTFNDTHYLCSSLGNEYNLRECGGYSIDSWNLSGAKNFTVVETTATGVIKLCSAEPEESAGWRIHLFLLSSLIVHRCVLYQLCKCFGSLDGESPFLTQVKKKDSDIQPSHKRDSNPCQRDSHYHGLVNSATILPAVNLSSSLYTETCVTPVEDSTGSLIIYYISFRTINFPCFPPYSFPVLHVIE